MRSFILLLGLLFYSHLAFSQDFHSLLEMKPEKTFENALVQPLNSDKHGSSFLIWVKDKVAAHFHEKHTEHVYILAGEGLMKIGEEERKVSAGDLLFIPQGMVHSLIVLSDEPMKALSIQTPEFHGADRHFIDE